MRDLLATFYTHYGAASFARRMKEAGVFHKMMPVPRKLSSSCGVCVKFAWQGEPPTEGEDLEAVYQIEGEDFRLVYQED